MSRYLADKSALARLDVQPVRDRLGPLIEAGEVAGCSIVDLELLYSARNLAEYEQLLDARMGLPQVELSQATFDGAIAIQHELAKRGRHRVSIPDLLIASAALIADVAVIHYDADFDLISEASGLRHEWVVPAGSI